MWGSLAGGVLFYKRTAWVREGKKEGGVTADSTHPMEGLHPAGPPQPGSGGRRGPLGSVDALVCWPLMRHLVGLLEGLPCVCVRACVCGFVIVFLDVNFHFEGSKAHIPYSSTI